MARQILKVPSNYQYQILGSYQVGAEDYEISPIEINEDGFLIVDISQTPITGIDKNGDVEKLIVDYRGYLVPIDYLHDIVHQYAMYTISHTFLSVASNGFARLRLKTGLDKVLHFDITFNADLKCRLKTYSSQTITSNGTLFQPFNRVIGYGDGTQTFEVYLNPTFTGGVLRGNDFIGSNTGQGSSAVRAGGGRPGGVESVLLPNQEYIIEFQNAGTSNSDIGVIINCYEKLNDFE
jgi:hypothetical protein